MANITVSSSVDSMLRASNDSGIRDAIGSINSPYTTDIEQAVATTRNLNSITTASGYNSNTNLQSIYIGSNVTSIGVNSFRGAANLSDVIIAGCDGFNIQASAFRDLQNLQKVILPSNLENLHAQVFRGCSNLSNIVLPRNASLSMLQNGTFRACSFSSINIPDSVQLLHTDVFRDCTNLTSITLPESLNMLYHQVFLNNTSLARIECLALNPPSRVGRIGTSPFVNVATSEIYIRPEAEVNWGSTYEGLNVVVDPNL